MAKAEENHEKPKPPGVAPMLELIKLFEYKYICIICFMNELGTVGQTMKPGQRGTVKWQQKFGDQLALVRYRYLPGSKKRQTTVELLVEETTWIPPREQMALVDIKWEEIDLRNLVKRAGGKWIPELKRWEISKDAAKRLGLHKRLDK